MKITKKETKIVIIGGGPAGATAAIQMARYGLPALLIERREIGGLLWNANLIENYPGFPSGVSGMKLIGLLKKQMEKVGVDIERAEVSHVDWAEERFTITTDVAEYSANYLIVASGTKSNPLPNVIQADVRKWVWTEVWPLSDIKDTHVAIVGAGDAAFDYALNLSKNRNIVTILNRGDSVKCLRLLFDRASKEPCINYWKNVALKEIKTSNWPTRIEVRCDTEEGEDVSIYVDHVLFAIGRHANLDFLSERIRDLESELVASGRLYFAGDVKNDQLRQVAIAAGDGLRAAMQIYSRMRK